MSFSVTGKTAIITGAASGVGLAVAKHLADAGANVMFADTDEARLAHELSDHAERENIRYFAGNLCERLTIANLISATIDSFDGIDILVNAARHMRSSDPLDPERDAMEELLGQNFYAALRLIQAVAKKMIALNPDDAACRGSIVNLSSIAARRTRPELLAWSVSSAALDQLTRSMAVALAAERIRVNAVAFGSVMSTSLQDAIRDDEAARNDIRDHTPLCRIAPPSELSHAVQYLASDASGFITGQILTIDGGRTLLDPVHTPAH